MKTILITGCSSGIGKAIAQRFARAHYRLIITGRRKERLHQLARDLNAMYGVEIIELVFDVRDRQACFDAVESLPEEWREIDVLVNNAGLAVGRDPFDQADLDDLDTMLDTNVKGLTYITRAVLPCLKKAEQGHIINMGSIAGKEVYANGNGYCASKFAVDALSQAMRIDLLPYRIKVTGIHPGAVQTEFSEVRFKGDKEKAEAMYQGYKPLQAEDVAEVVYYATTQPPHVCINELVITPIAQASSFYLHKQNQ